MGWIGADPKTLGTALWPRVLGQVVADRLETHPASTCVTVKHSLPHVCYRTQLRRFRSNSAGLECSD